MARLLKGDGQSVQSVFSTGVSATKKPVHGTAERNASTADCSSKRC